MVRTFCVAGQLFTLLMKDDNPLWGCLRNYAPFECAPGPDMDVMFTLAVVDIPALRERTLVFDGYDEDPGMARLAIYSTPEGLSIDMSVTQNAPVCATLDLKPDFSFGEMCITDDSFGRFPVDNALMLMYAFSGAPRGLLEMHASAVVNGGKAYLNLGVSGAGKSTHSRLWLENIPGSVLLNDDNPVVRVMPGTGEIIAYGTPWSGKTPCYRNESAPVASVVSIKKAPHNAIRPLDIFESYAMLYSSCSGLKFDPAMSDALHESISAFAERVNAWELECLPDADAARTCYEAVANGKQ